MCEAGEWAGGGCQASAGQYMWWGDAAPEPETLPGEGTAEGTGFQAAEESALWFVFDQKKRLALKGRGNT